eukprot:TRINITY_DN55188_c0_g1_i1.p1 TRINITY_DN55188_c0_g1~~TRINITY_DN55188_c0_g1_i1.p1  ORF type:complete len:393 (+),score=56.85 TRINITY_DN55188_c0_g1_i1:56-1180(+)
MTWLNGRKPRDLSPEERIQLVRLAAPCLSLQLMDAGFVHCDPHEGNMMLLDDGRLGLIDFGLVTQMTEVHQESMASGILNLVAKDYRSLVSCFRGMGILNTAKGRDEELMRPGETQPFAEALEEALSGGGRRQRVVQVADGEESSDRRRAFGQLYEELSGLAFRYYFTLPSYYVLVMRSFVTLEGIAFGADPDFNMYTTSYPFAFKRMLSPRTVEGRELLSDALCQSLEGSAKKRLKLFALFKDNRISMRSSTGTESDSGSMIGSALAEVFVSSQGKELRRVFSELDSELLLVDICSPEAKPIFRSFARMLARQGQGKKQQNMNSSSHLKKKRQGLVKKLAYSHICRASRTRPLLTASCALRLFFAVVRQKLKR